MDWIGDPYPHELFPYLAHDVSYLAEIGADTLLRIHLTHLDHLPIDDDVQVEQVHNVCNLSESQIVVRNVTFGEFVIAISL